MCVTGLTTSLTDSALGVSLIIICHTAFIFLNTTIYSVIGQNFLKYCYIMHLNRHAYIYHISKIYKQLRTTACYIAVNQKYLGVGGGGGGYIPGHLCYQGSRSCPEIPSNIALPSTPRR